eukprot:TRINITY_DN13009_c0_g1_i1.p1 TRINITY_DN13009_c0_g1~~TRINITY_DN13009_c0_g1_i1.p1  ORF type:complete len:181 (+),score=38.82 TRINITY_DN13009_c0_g1_i1:67-543(+)
MSSAVAAIPPEGGDELVAKYFAEITLDVVEQSLFRKRCMEEPGPRFVHLRRTAVGVVTVPPHIEENKPGKEPGQVWTGHPKVDRTMFIMDRRLELQRRQVKEISGQKNIPMLRGILGKKNFGTKMTSEPLMESHRSARMNSSKRPPFATLPPIHMDIM